MAMAGGLDQGGVDQLAEMLARRDEAEVITFRAPHDDPNAPQKDLLSDH